MFWNILSKNREFQENGEKCGRAHNWNGKSLQNFDLHSFAALWAIGINSISFDCPWTFWIVLYLFKSMAGLLRSEISLQSIFIQQKIAWDYDIQSWTFSYICLLSKHYINKDTLKGNIIIIPDRSMYLWSEERVYLFETPSYSFRRKSLEAYDFLLSLGS